ncbi:hypothetical protein F4083_00260 [Candidatus Poribacteria bacterium]|nr:hypothetical protein [Candidatus Poribacteria bacterium]MYI92753.1 hypothetical protein [Candidatus Poribacteria bacterium]
MPNAYHRISADSQPIKKLSICLLCIILTSVVLLTNSHAQPHIVFVVGEGEYRSEVTMSALAKVLSENYDFRTTVLIDEELHGGEENNIEGLDALETADLLVLYLRFRQLPDAQLGLLQEYIDRGGPIIAFRTTTHAFAYDEEDHRAEKWNNFGARELGAPWIYHYGHGASTDATLVGEHPVLTGVSPEFHVRSWTYHVRPNYPPKDAQILVNGRPVFPDGERGDEETVNAIAWTHTHSGGGRVFTTTMGHPDDFRSSDFRRLIVNGVYWCLEREAPRRYTSGWRIKTGQRWRDMDYGPFLSTAVKATSNNLTYKGIIIPLTPDLTGGSVVFDTDLLRYSAGWIDGLIDFADVEFNGWHQSYPSIEGKLLWENPVEPGWAKNDSFEDTRTVPFGPLPRDWAHWKGLYLHEKRVVMSYTVGTRSVLETPSLESNDKGLAFVRTFHLGPSKSSSLVRIAKMKGGEVSALPDLSRGTAVALYSQGTEAGAPNSLLAALIDAPEGTQWETLQDEIRVRFPASEQPITAKIMITPTIHDKLDLNVWKEFIKSSSAVSDLPALIQGGPKRWSEKLTTTGQTDIEQRLRVEREEIRAGKTTIHLELEGYQPKVLSMKDLSPAPKGVGDADQYIAVLFPDPKTSEVSATHVQKNDSTLIGYWRFDEGTGIHTASALQREATISLDGVRWDDGIGIKGSGLLFDGESEAVFNESIDIDFDTSDLTFSAWIATEEDGSIFSEALEEPEWVPNGKTFFIRNGQLAFDVGWVGVVTSSLSEGKSVNDGAWHHVGLIWEHQNGAVKLFLDGKIVAEGTLMPNEPLADDVLRLGFTAENFPEQSPWFEGRIDEMHLYSRALSLDEMQKLYTAEQESPLIAAAIIGADKGAKWRVESDRVYLNCTTDETASFFKWDGSEERLSEFARLAANDGVDPGQPFAIDKIVWPADNPWDSWIRFGGFDFFSDGNRAALSTWNGDVWIVTGLNDTLKELVWQRIATGLNQPLGLKIVKDEIYVLGRDQITRLVDLNADGETDFYQNFNNDVYNSEHFHEQAMDLQTDAAGNFYYMKSGRHALRASHPHHGTLMKVTPDGEESTVIAYGFRASNGLGISPGPVFYGTDQEGFWMPANRLNRITAGGKFYGNLWGWHPPGETPTGYEPPLCWLAPFVDRSPATVVWIPDGTWGEMEDSLLSVSYGTGKVYAVLQHKTGETVQGAVTEMDLDFPTGVMRGRFHPVSKDLYLAGLFGWSSNKHGETGFYRVRMTGAPLRTAKAFRAVNDGLIISFYAPLAPDSATKLDNWRVQSWEYRWTQNYGSPQLKRNGAQGRDEHPVQSVTLSEDGKTVFLSIPSLTPTMQFHVNFKGNFADGIPLEGYLHGTIHALEDIDSSVGQ